MNHFVCAHCLETTEADDYPTTCGHCRVGYCVACSARVKHPTEHPSWCSGCGTIPVRAVADMFRVASTVGAYAVDDWTWDGVLPTMRRQATLRSPRFRRFGVAHGWQTAAARDRPPTTWLYSESYDARDGEVVRTLTGAEAALLGYAP